MLSWGRAALIALVCGGLGTLLGREGALDQRLVLLVAAGASAALLVAAVVELARGTRDPLLRADVAGLRAQVTELEVMLVKAKSSIDTLLRRSGGADPPRSGTGNYPAVGE